MPIYSYKCKNCNKTFDKMLKADGNGNIKCIYCNSDSQRLFSPVGIIFKGSGFYVNDYKSSSNKADSNSKDKAGKPDKEAKENKSGSSDTGTKDAGSKTGKEKSAKSHINKE